MISLADAGHSVGVLTPRLHCGYHLPRIRVFSVDERPFLIASMPAARPRHGERPGEHVARHEPVRSTPILEKTAATSSSLRSLTPSDAHAARNCARSHCSARDPRVGDERCGDDVNLPSVLLASLRDGVHIFSGRPRKPKRHRGRRAHARPLLRTSTQPWA